MSIKNEALAELATARDEARLHAHLLSMDARERWATLESKLESLERKLIDAGEHATQSALESASVLARVVVEFFREHAQQSGPALSVPAGAIMSDGVRSCLPGDSLNRAAQIMWEANCGALPVVSHEGLIVGMISDRDVCMASYTQGQALQALTVEHAMSTGVKAVSVDEPISRVLEIMQTSQVRRVPVIRAGTAVGMVSLADIAGLVQRQRVGRVAASDALATTLAAISRAPDFQSVGAAEAAE